MKPLAASIGDVNGVAPEILAAVWRAQNTQPFVVVGRAEPFADLAPTRVVASLAEAPAVFAHALPVAPVAWKPFARAPGAPCAEADALARDAFDCAVRLALAGEARAVVTAPLSKRAFASGGKSVEGHTERLARLAPDASAPFGAALTLHGRGVRVALATNHVAPAEVGARLRALGAEGLRDLGALIARDMNRLFGVKRARIAVSALNPHGGEDGALGDEEARVIAPAVEAMRAAGVRASGPHAADSLFTPRARRGWDIALCMSHDQGLAPLKALDPDAVNITFGVSVIRASPDHGPAYDLAGTGRASPRSLARAFALADAITTRARA